MGEHKLPKDIRRGGISDDPLANAIRYWWLAIGGPAGLLQGTFNSSYELANFLREKGFIKEGLENGSKEGSDVQGT